MEIDACTINTYTSIRQFKVQYICHMYVWSIRTTHHYHSAATLTHKCTHSHVHYHTFSIIWFHLGPPHLLIDGIGLPR